jgi:KipI family sensor histidine kinase inhibitor
MRLLPYGRSALLVEVDSLEESMQLAAALRGARLPYVADLVLAERSVLVVTDGALDELRRDLPILPLQASPVPAEPGEVVELPVTYDGPDIEVVASLTGLSPEQVVTAHTGKPWVVAFGGFVPGFAYLVGGDTRLEVPRRADPRTQVPAGAVALGGRYSGVYPRETPGGWQLIGRTDATLWDATRDPPALLRPGVQVRFVEASRKPGAAPELNRGHTGTDLEVRSRRGPAEAGPAAAGPARVVEVLAVGAPVLVQDLGRTGMATWGVSRAGAADRGSHRLAQRLVANDEDDAGLEVLLGGLRLRAHGDLLMAVTGAPVPIRVDGRQLPLNAPFRLRDGADLSLGTPSRGVRSYVAIRGGLAVPAVLGSRSTDTLASLGPAPVSPGDLLPVGAPPQLWPVVDVAPQPMGEPDPVRLLVTPGPRRDRLLDPAEIQAEWTVSEDADRVGIRLIGEPLRVRAEPDAPSEGALPGAVQVPPNGLPLMFGVDSPVTGGHPVVAVVRDTDALAQLRPGQRVRLRWAAG